MAVSARNALAGYVGQMPDLCVEVGGDVFASGRLGAATPARNAESVAWWNGESEGNWLAAWLGHVALVGSADDRETARARVARILGHQSGDGYLGMFAEAHRADRGVITGDLWTQTCLLRALRSWADAEHDESVHDAVDRAIRRTCAHLHRALADGTAFRDTRRTGHDLMFIDVLYDAYLREPDPTFAATAVALYDAFSSADIDAPFADFQRDRLLSDAPMTGHGAHVAEHARVPLQIAVMTGGPDGSWTELFGRGMTKLSVAAGSSGGIRSDETLGAPGQAPVHLAEAGEEQCALTELADTYLHAAAVSGDLRWVDRAEAILLNAAPAGVLADGTAVGYLHAENQTAATRSLGTRWDYSPTHDDAAVCCAPNAGRLLPLALRHAVVRMPEGWLVQLYGPMTLTLSGRNGEVRLRQRTSFPFGEDVDIEVSAGGEVFTLELRVPGWCREASVVTARVDEVVIERRAMTIAVTGRWGDASTVRLTLAQSLDVVPTADGRVALRLGPLTLAAPIVHRAVATRRYPGSNLRDLDIVPADGAARSPLVLREARLSEARVERAGGEVSGADTGVRVTVPMIDPSPRSTATTGSEDTEVVLVPIGQTTLRQTVFSMVRSG